MGRSRYEAQAELARKKEVNLIRIPTALDYFGVGRTKLMEIAEEANAKIVLNNNMVWIDRQAIEDYLYSFRV